MGGAVMNFAFNLSGTSSPVTNVTGSVTREMALMMAPFRTNCSTALTSRATRASFDWGWTGGELWMRLLSSSVNS